MKELLLNFLKSLHYFCFHFSITSKAKRIQNYTILQVSRFVMATCSISSRTTSHKIYHSLTSINQRSNSNINWRFWHFQLKIENLGLTKTTNKTTLKIATTRHSFFMYSATPALYMRDKRLYKPKIIRQIWENENEKKKKAYLQESQL